jgi:putative hydrolase of the HAD superfamily
MPTTQIPTKLLAVIGPCRSGTTCLATAIAQHSSIHAIYQPLKEENGHVQWGHRQLYAQPNSDSYHPALASMPEGKIPFYKQVTGPLTEWRSKFPLFVDDKEREKTLPVFLIRHPDTAYASWTKMGWNDTGNVQDPVAIFKAAYMNIVNEAKQFKEKNLPALSLTFESYVLKPEQSLKRICGFFNIPYTNELMNWKKPFDEAFEFEPNMKQFYISEESESVFKGVRQSNGISHQIPEHDLTRSSSTQFPDLMQAYNEFEALSSDLVAAP